MEEAAAVQEALQVIFTPALHTEDIKIAKQILHGLTDKSKLEMLKETLEVRHSVLAVSHKSTGIDN